MNKWKYIKVNAETVRWNVLMALPKPALMRMAKAHGLSVRGSKAAIVKRFPYDRIIHIGVCIDYEDDL